MSNSWATVGKIKEAHSLKGEVYFLIFSGEAAWLDQLKAQSVQLVDESGDRPKKTIKILKYRPHKKGFIAFLEGVTDRTQAEGLKGYILKVPGEFLTSSPGEDIYLSEVSGFSVVSNGQSIGVVTGFSSNGAQDLIIVKNKTSEYDIPFIKEFIDKIDFEGKKIFMSLPEGLLDL